VEWEIEREPAPKDPQRASTNLTKYRQRKGDHFKMRWPKLPNPAKFIHVVWEVLRFDLSDQLKFQQTTGSVLRDHFSDYTAQEPDTTVHE
jgi:hypothetical protein